MHGPTGHELSTPEGYALSFQPERPQLAVAAERAFGRNKSDRFAAVVRPVLRNPMGRFGHGALIRHSSGSGHFETVAFSNGILLSGHSGSLVRRFEIFVTDAARFSDLNLNSLGA